MRYLFILLIIIANSCNYLSEDSDLDTFAHELVDLTLKMGEYDPDLVDSYIGEQVLDTNVKYDLKIINEKLIALKSKLTSVKLNTEFETYRKNYQLAMINSLEYRLKILNKEKTEFLNECETIYQFRPKLKHYSYFDSLLKKLDDLIPGQGNLRNRISNYRKQFIVKKENIKNTFKLALDYAAKNTRKHIQLPNNESIEIELVEGAPWSAYNWYKGNYKSLIQVNQNVDIHFERILDLAAHESYPGHHVYYTKREQNYYKDSGFVEFSIYTLFSPVSFLAEGTAEYGIDLVFPENEKIEFIKNNIDEAKNISENDLKNYFNILEILERLDESIVNISKQYLDEEIRIEEAIILLQKYGLESEKGAIRRMNFARRYRSYVMNYTLGKRFVKEYIENKNPINKKQKWEIYRDLIEKPYLPNDLIEDSTDYSSI